MKFDVIVIDPCWSFADKLTMSETPRGAETNYKTLSNNDLFELDIKSLADPDGCLLAIWVPSSLLDVGLKCMESYGFKLKSTYVWNKIKINPLKSLFKTFKSKLNKENSKTEIVNFLNESISLFIDNFGNNISGFFMGHLFRQCHEICIIGINNKKIYKKLKNKSQRSISFAYNLKHSSKPENLQDSLELMFPNSKNLELFARRQRKNWICMGNESPISMKEDIFVSISKLQNLTEDIYNNIINTDKISEKIKYWNNLK